MTWRELSDLFVQIELELIASLRRNLTAHKAWEEKEGFRWPAWQEEKIQNLESFRRENQGIIGRYVSVIDQETEAMLRDQYAEGIGTGRTGNRNPSYSRALLPASQP